VSAGDYRGFVRESHLAYVNERLRNERFRGLMVVTPYVPDLSRQPVGAPRVAEYADWLAGPMLEAVRERFEGAARTRAGTGIDGVSLGGRVALEAGFSHPEAFGAVGGLQPAIRGAEEGLARLAVEAARAHPQRVRLLTSDEDRVSLVATRRLSSELAERRLTHTLTLVPGPHGYAFNRGPAALEMLLFHDRALAREPLPEDSPLRVCERVILTPNVAGATEDALRETALQCAEQIADVLAGRRPPHLVNPDVWDRRRDPTVAA